MAKETKKKEGFLELSSFGASEEQELERDQGMGDHQKGKGVLELEQEQDQEEKEIIFSVGVSFRPTDEQLIVYYLMNKILDLRLPNKIIKDIDFYSFHPGDLHMRHRIDRMKEAYFFAAHRKERSYYGGYWCPSGVVFIKNAREDLIGVRRTMIFREGTPSHSKGTDWVVQEYQMRQDPMSNLTARWDALVLCKLFNAKNEEEEEEKKVMLRSYDWKKKMFQSLHDPSLQDPCRLPFSLQDPKSNKTARWDPLVLSKLTIARNEEEEEEKKVNLRSSDCKKKVFQSMNDPNLHQEPKSAEDDTSMHHQRSMSSETSQDPVILPQVATEQSQVLTLSEDDGIGDDDSSGGNLTRSFSFDRWIAP